MLDSVVDEQLWDPAAARPGSLFVDPDVFRFPASRVTIIGFLLPQPFDDSERFSQTYVTQDYQGIWPDLFDETVSGDEVAGYGFTRSFIPSLTPQYVWYDYDWIYAPNLADYSIHPIATWPDTDRFHGWTINAGLAPDHYNDVDLIRGQLVWREGDPLALLPELAIDVDVVSSPSISWLVLPSLISDVDVFYSPRRQSVLVPAAIPADDGFPVAVILSQLRPQLVVGDDLLPGPALGTPGRMDTHVDLDLLLLPSVSLAPLVASLVADADSFLSPVIGSNPAIWPLVTYAEPDQFYTPVVSQNQALVPHLWIELDFIYSVPAVILGQATIPPLLVDPDTFFAPVAFVGIGPSAWVDADLITPPVLASALLYPPAVSDGDLLYAPTGFTAIGPAAMVSADAFYAPAITSISWSGALSLSGPIMPAVPPPTVILVES